MQTRPLALRAADVTIEIHSGCAVRVTHLPTGRQVECADYTTFLRNKIAALAKLRDLLDSQSSSLP